MMRVGDFFDAMGGYNEAQGERIKILAELMRIATSLLWNIQVSKEDKRKPIDLWPMPWDKNTEKYERISEEEYKKRMDKSIEILNKYFPNGNSNLKS